MNGPRQETRDCSPGCMATRVAGIPAIPRMRPTVPARRKAAAGLVGHAGHQCITQWRSVAGTFNHAGAWLVWPHVIGSRDKGACRGQSFDPDPTRWAQGLQSVGCDPVPAGLRPEEDRSPARLLPDNRLRRGKGCAGNAAHCRPARCLAKSQKKHFGMPRHGTKYARTVPPRDKPERSNGQERGLCTATGQNPQKAALTLYRHGAPI